MEEKRNAEKSLSPQKIPEQREGLLQKDICGHKKVTPNREVESDNIYNLMLGKRDYSAMQITTRFSSFTLKG